MGTGRRRAGWAIAGIGTALLAFAALLAASVHPVRAAGFVAACSPVGAPTRIFHVDPVRGTRGGDGSAARPWRRLSEVAGDGLIGQQVRRASFVDRAVGRLLGRTNDRLVENARARVGDGDTLWLHDGDHGDVDLGGVENRRFVTIAAAPGARPRLASLSLHSASHFVLRGLIVTGPMQDGGGYLITARALPRVTPADNLRFEAMEIGTAAPLATAPADRWGKAGRDGILLTGGCLSLRDSRIHDVRFGVALYDAVRTVVAGNVVDGFSVDGIEFSGRSIVIRDNLIRNHRMTDEAYHPDCMQGQADGPGDLSANVVIEHNMCIGGGPPSAVADPYLQGISSFDGQWHGIAIRCNLVLATAAHGIALYGAQDARIEHNVVIARLPARTSWIAALPSGPPERRQPVRNRITGNIASGYLNAATGGPLPVAQMLARLGASGDPAIVAEIERGVGGVTLADNALAIATAAQGLPRDPRFSVRTLDWDGRALSPDEARRRYPLPAACAR